MHRYLYLVLTVLIGFAVSAQAGSSSDSTILVLGDSLSAAYGLDVERGWVNLLQQRLSEQGYSYQVVNASISGETTHGALTRLPNILEREHPQLVIIELGGNDGLRGISLDEMQSNLVQMVKLCKEHGAGVLLLGMRLPPNYGPSYTERFHAIYKIVAEQTGVKYLEFFLEGVAEDRGLMQSDGIHPTVEAQATLLDNVWPLIESILQK
jgi:acyl-CoA thioesterase I